MASSSAGYGWGILGAGKIARTFVSDLQGAGLTVTAVGSRTAASAAEFAREFGIAASHGSYDALVADPAVDIVYIATPQPFHLEQALLAIAAGKHVLVEKSFTRNAVEAETLAAAARTAGVFAMEAMWTRFMPTMTAVQERIAAGAIGEVSAITVDHSQCLTLVAGNRHLNPALGGGAMLDLGVYGVSLAQWILGAPTSLTAVATLSEEGVDLSTTATMVHAGGAVSVHTTTMTNPGPNRATIIGDRGYIELDAYWFSSTGFTVYDAGRPSVAVERWEPDVAGRGMHFQALEVEKCLSEGRLESAIMPLDDSIAVMRILDEIRRQSGVVYPGE